MDSVIAEESNIQGNTEAVAQNETENNLETMVQNMVEKCLRKATTKGKKRKIEISSSSELSESSDDDSNQMPEQSLIDDESDTVYDDQISESLAQLVIKRSSEEMDAQLLKKKVERYSFPVNCILHNTRVNPEIWSTLPKSARSKDSRLVVAIWLLKNLLLFCY